MKENKYLKWLLIIQSFLPLFLLILIRCFCLNNFKLVSQFFIRLFQKDFGVILIALNHPDLFSVILLCLSVIMLIIGIMIYVLFNKIQKFGFCEEHENIAVDADVTENAFVDNTIAFLTKFNVVEQPNMNYCNERRS